MKNLSQDTPAYRVIDPDQVRSCVVFSSPHSGRAYSKGFLEETILDPLTLRSSEDAYVDQLVAGLSEFGAPFICAHAPRAYLDLNRAIDEMDPAVVQGVQSRGQNPRIASGLGVIPRVVAGGRPIYSGKISKSEATQRLHDHWFPYHAALDQLLNRAHHLFGSSILIDLHSMPHEAVASPAKSVPSTDIVIGDRYGSSCSRDIVDAVIQCFSDVGMRVSVNAPFAGAYIVQHYGRPSQNLHAIQIEIDRALYLDEKQIVLNDRFEETRKLVMSALKQIAMLLQDQLPLAAE